MSCREFDASKGKDEPWGTIEGRAVAYELHRMSIASMPTGRLYTCGHTGCGPIGGQKPADAETKRNNRSTLGQPMVRIEHTHGQNPKDRNMKNTEVPTKTRVR